MIDVIASQPGSNKENAMSGKKDCGGEGEREGEGEGRGREGSVGDDVNEGGGNDVDGGNEGDKYQCGRV